MKTIKQKILDDHKRIMDETDPEVQEKLAEDVGKLAIQALKDGMRSRAWANYMKLYIENSDQLKRLCGEDEDFNKEPWGERCLAYIVSNTVCTITTRRSPISMENSSMPNEGTLNYMDDKMKDALDV